LWKRVPRKPAIATGTKHARYAGILHTYDENPSNFSIDTIVDRINKNGEAWDTKL